VVRWSLLRPVVLPLFVLMPQAKKKKKLARTAPLLNRGRPSVFGVVGSLLVPHLALLQGDTQSRGLPPVRCASAGAERREGGLCADPACNPPAKKHTHPSCHFHSDFISGLGMSDADRRRYL
jgi:hypothetical protein